MLCFRTQSTMVHIFIPPCPPPPLISSEHTWYHILASWSPHKFHFVVAGIPLHMSVDVDPGILTGDLVNDWNGIKNEII